MCPAEVESIKIRVLLRTANGGNLSPIRGLGSNGTENRLKAADSRVPLDRSDVNIERLSAFP